MDGWMGTGNNTFLDLFGDAVVLVHGTGKLRTYIYTYLQYVNASMVVASNESSTK